MASQNQHCAQTCTMCFDVPCLATDVDCQGKTARVGRCDVDGKCTACVRDSPGEVMG